MNIKYIKYKKPLIPNPLNIELIGELILYLNTNYLIDEKYEDLFRRDIKDMSIDVYDFAERLRISISEIDIDERYTELTKSRITRYAKARMDFDKNKYGNSYTHILLVDRNVSKQKQRCAIAYELGTHIINKYNEEENIPSQFKVPLFGLNENNVYSRLIGALILMPPVVLAHYCDSISQNKYKTFDEEDFYKGLSKSFDLELIDTINCYNTINTFLQ